MASTMTDEELLAWKPRMGMLTVAEKLQDAETIKLQANLFFKQGEVKKAVRTYAKVSGEAPARLFGRCVRVCQRHLGQGDAMSTYVGNSANMSATPEEGVQIRALQIASWSNMALCQIKLGNGDKALQLCDKVLAEDDKHSKARFRRAQALALLKHHDRARTLLMQLAKEEPKNAAIRNELVKVAQAAKADAEEAKKHNNIANMFNKKGGVGLYDE
ncbi:TPA: hypothetical protein N0F65_011798 [Lagenidium giganteum]|uniref:peptidylprolyl isomerase n=1 Tax=Lagenidium giganteum TaxID=4803 RepID=A0AAV2YTL0_9STRA|nr:TPA: hypothetical protein N0F65_011798 [Lagenidium giganteum]